MFKRVYYLSSFTCLGLRIVLSCKHYQARVATAVGENTAQILQITKGFSMKKKKKKTVHEVFSPNLI